MGTKRRADLVGQPVTAAGQLVAQRGARRHGVFSGGCRPRAVWRGPARSAGPLCSGAVLDTSWQGLLDDLLAWQAMQWRDSHSARQSERRTLVKTEGALFAALQGHAAGLPLDLAALAHEQGFADQAHLSRATKCITGFSPAEFARRFIEDESFWVYRLWV